MPRGAYRMRYQILLSDLGLHKARCSGGVNAHHFFQYLDQNRLVLGATLEEMSGIPGLRRIAASSPRSMETRPLFQARSPDNVCHQQTTESTKGQLHPTRPLAN